MPNDDDSSATVTTTTAALPSDFHSNDNPVMELLARRLGRLEARVYGGGGNTTPATMDLRARLQAVAARVVSLGEQVGEAGARQQLEREMLLSEGALAPPPACGGGVGGLAAVLAAQEAELRGMLEGLERVERLKKACVDEPWPVLGGGGGNKEAAALKQRLAALEARFWGAETVAAALAREVDELLTAYDDVVAMLSRKCVEWEARVAAHARRKQRQ